jgi:hypothetical protein
MRFRVRVNAPLLPHSSGRSAGMKWFIWGGFYLPDPPGGQVRNITYFYNGAAHGGDDLQYTTVKLGAGVSASSVQALIPNYQWVHVQTAFKWGSEGVGFQRIYVNNNNVGSPTAENMQFNDLTSQTWTFPGSALDNQMFWADIVSDNSRIREDAVIDIMDMEIDDQFDPAWYPGGGPPPPPSPGSRCDVDVSGSTNVVDVQLCVNQVLGTSGCSAGDIDLNGSCNVVDVQRVVNAALGGACVAQ